MTMIGLKEDLMPRDRVEFKAIKFAYFLTNSLFFFNLSSSMAWKNTGSFYYGGEAVLRRQKQRNPLGRSYIHNIEGLVWTAIVQTWPAMLFAYSDPVNLLLSLVFSPNHL